MIAVVLSRSRASEVIAGETASDFRHPSRILPKIPELSASASPSLAVSALQFSKIPMLARIRAADRTSVSGSRCEGGPR